MSQWRNKVCVITGAASGIGAGLTRYATAQGMQVVAVDVDMPALTTLQQALAQQNYTIEIRHCDVSQQASVEQLAEFVFCQYQQVNLLFNNAGIMLDGKSWQRKIEDWRLTVDVNVMGVVHGIHAFVPRMLEQGTSGRVINTSSIGGLLGGSAYMALYQGSKHFITAISESLYQELQLEEADITASVLCPAEVATAISDSQQLCDQQMPSERQAQEQQFHDMLAAGIGAGISADQLAPMVFAGIEADRFWLTPQPAFTPMLEARTKDIIDAKNPVGFIPQA